MMRFAAGVVQVKNWAKPSPLVGETMNLVRERAATEDWSREIRPSGSMSGRWKRKTARGYCSLRHYLQNKEGGVLRILRFTAADLLVVK